MKKSKFFMAAGALVLAATAVFATKANKKFANFSTLSFTSGAINVSVAYGSLVFTTFSFAGTSQQLKFAVYTTGTVNATQHILTSGAMDANNGDPAYLK